MLWHQALQTWIQAGGLAVSVVTLVFLIKYVRATKGIERAAVEQSQATNKLVRAADDQTKVSHELVKAANEQSEGLAKKPCGGIHRRIHRQGENRVGQGRAGRACDSVSRRVKRTKALARPGVAPKE